MVHLSILLDHQEGLEDYLYVLYFLFEQLFY